MAEEVQPTDRKDRPRRLELKHWIVILLVALIVANILMFLLYRMTKPGEDIWLQLVAYFQSDLFNVITILILLPILMLILERIFDIRESMRKRIQAEKDRIRQRDEKEADRQRERRWECVDETCKIWNELFSLASEVRYFKKNPDKKARIEDILQKLERLDCEGQGVVNKWLFRFPNLKREHAGICLIPVNVLLNSAETVAHHIRNESTEEISSECRKLQDALGVIQESIKSIAHHNILIVLKRSAELLYLSTGEKEKNEKKKNAIEAKIRRRIRLLRDWGNWLQRIVVQYGVLPSVKDNKGILAIRNWVEDEWKRWKDERKDWLAKDPNRELRDFKKFKLEFKDLEIAAKDKSRDFIANIDDDTLGAVTKPYTKELIKFLAKWLILVKLHRKWKELLNFRLRGEKQAGAKKGSDKEARAAHLTPPPAPLATTALRFHRNSPGL